MNCHHNFTQVEITPEIVATLRVIGDGILWVDDEKDPIDYSWGFIIDEIGPDGEPGGPLFHEVYQCSQCGAYMISQSGGDAFVIIPSNGGPSTGRIWSSQ